MKRVIFVLLLLFLLPLFFNVHAHLTIYPKEARSGIYHTFSVFVPNEGTSPIIGLKLMIPENVTNVFPNIRPGWNTKITKDDSGTNIVAVEWTGGKIDPELRDEFQVVALVPDKKTTILWKAYEMYEDGTVLEWVQDPNAEDTKYPYSVTKVYISEIEDSLQDNKRLEYISYGAFIIAFISLALQYKTIVAILRRK